MTFPKYPAYKDSGVEWLGEVPEHWDVKPLKFSASCNDTVLPDSTDDDYEIKYVEISDVDEVLGITGSASYKFSDAPSRARRTLKDGDVLISTVRTYLRAIAPVINPKENLIASTGFAVVRPRKENMHGAFLGYLLRAEWWISEVIARSVGVSYPAINASDLIGLPVAVPVLQEQTQIARFLDHEAARIDALIAEQQRLIELLKEKRQAVISQAVTKGLDPNVSMKDSGVEWLGKVPAHWNVVSLKRLAELVTDRASSSDFQVGLENIDGWTGQFVETDAEFSGDGITFLQEDILFGKLRPYLAKVWRADRAGQAVGDFFVLRPRMISSEFLHSYILTPAVIADLNASTIGAKMPRVGWEDMSALVVTLPPRKEQTQIAMFLDHETARIHALIDEAEVGIELLQERRAALISAAVTGKIDVRGWRPPEAEAHLATETQADRLEAV